MKHCNHCDTDFANPSSLKRHLSTKHPETLNGSGIVKSQHRCSVCSINFARNETLERHHRSKHTLELRRTCPFCLECFRHDYCKLHEPGCSKKYWAKICKNATYVGCSGPAQPVNGLDEGRLASSTEPKSLRVMQELVVDASLATKSLSDTLLYFLEHDDADSFLEALTAGFLMGIHADSNPLYFRPDRSDFRWCRDLIRSLDTHARGKIHINKPDGEGFTLLHFACLAGAVGLLEPLFWRGANFENTTYRGNTPLVLAVHEGHLDTVRFALALGADPDYQEDSGILACAISNKRHDIATILIEHGADCNKINKYDNCLKSALRSGEMEEARFLLSLGIDPNRLMHSAFEVNILNEDVARILIKHGADINRGDYDGKDSPLLARAVYRKDLDKVTYLLSLGANPNIGLSLHYAVNRHLVDIANLLVQSGANIDRPAKYSEDREQTPVCCAVSWGRLESVRLAILLGADVNVGSPILTAIKRQDTGIAVLLVEHGADVCVKGFNGKTPLHLAAERADVALLRAILAQSSTSRLLATTEGLVSDAMYLAVSNAYNTSLNRVLKILSMLLDARADAKAYSIRYCDSALSFASAAGYERVLQLLLKTVPGSSRQTNCT